MKTKFDPESTRGKPVPPSTAPAGERLAKVGSGLRKLIVSSAGFDTPPPGMGEKTVTSAAPTAVTSLAEISAWSSVLLTNVVGRSLPFQRTWEVAAKPVPLTLSVKAGDPAGMVSGRRLVIAGNGFF